jgi:ADP-ribose pyrophosphatase
MRLHCSKQTPNLPGKQKAGTLRTMTAVPTSVFGRGDVDILESTTCYQGFLRIDRLRLRCRLYEGGWSREITREVLHREPGIGVLLYDLHLDKVLMVEQFRVGCLDDRDNGPWALELVAGLLDDASESPEDVAKRESQEEAGVSVSRLLRICSYYNSPGGSSERLTVFCGGFDSRNAGGIFGVDSESENIRTVILTRVEALAAVRQGRINNAMSIIALQWLELHLDAVRKTLAL